MEDSILFAAKNCDGDGIDCILSLLGDWAVVLRDSFKFGLFTSDALLLLLLGVSVLGLIFGGSFLNLDGDLICTLSVVSSFRASSESRCRRSCSLLLAEFLEASGGFEGGVAFACFFTSGVGVCETAKFSSFLNIFLLSKYFFIVQGLH